MAVSRYGVGDLFGPVEDDFEDVVEVAGDELEEGKLDEKPVIQLVVPDITDPDFELPAGYEATNLKMIEDGIYGLARPGFPDKIGNAKYTLKVLYNLGVTVLLSLSNKKMSDERDPLIRAIWLNNNVDPMRTREFCSIVTEDHVGDVDGQLNPDYAPPSDTQIEQFTQILERAKKADKIVAIYCGEGLGRTGFYMAARQVLTTDCTMEQALAWLGESYHEAAAREVRENGSSSRLSELSSPGSRSRSDSSWK